MVVEEGAEAMEGEEGGVAAALEEEEAAIEEEVRQEAEVGLVAEEMVEGEGAEEVDVAEA